MPSILPAGKKTRRSVLLKLYFQAVLQVSQAQDHIESLNRGEKKRTGRLQRQNDITGQFLQPLCMHPVHLRDVHASKGKTVTAHTERKRDRERGNLT
jgi:hypothetical protein